MRLRTQARFELEAAQDMVRSERVEAIVEEATAPTPEAKEGEKKVADADAKVCPMYVRSCARCVGAQCGFVVLVLVVL